MPDSSDSDLRRKILDVTRRLLVQDGYQNVSMRKIARATGTSATSIYLYFQNKDTLFHTLIEEGFERLYRELTAAADGILDPVERLETLGRSYIDFALRNPEYYEIMLYVRADTMQRFPPRKYRRARRTLDCFADTLRAGIEAGVFGVESAEVQACVVWATLHGAVALLCSTRIDAGIEAGAFADAAVRHAVQGCVTCHTTTEEITKPYP